MYIRPIALVVLSVHQPREETKTKNDKKEQDRV